MQKHTSRHHREGLVHPLPVRKGNSADSFTSVHFGHIIDDMITTGHLT